MATGPWTTGCSRYGAARVSIGLGLLDKIETVLAKDHLFANKNVGALRSTGALLKKQEWTMKGDASYSFFRIQSYRHRQNLIGAY